MIKYSYSSCLIPTGWHMKVRKQKKKKLLPLLCGPRWNMDNNVADINVAYDKWILKASDRSLGLCLCEKLMRRLAGGRGSICARRPGGAVNQHSGLHQWCQRGGHNTSQSRREAVNSAERTFQLESLPLCVCVCVPQGLSARGKQEH